MTRRATPRAGRRAIHPEISRLKAAGNSARVTREAPRNRRASELPRVLLGDSMGEMALYYATADLALMGGSFLPYGSQNLIESCAAGTPVVLGPSTYNFAQAARDALAAGAAIQVDSMDAALTAAREILGDPARLAAMREHAIAFAAAHRGATGRTVALLDRCSRAEKPATSAMPAAPVTHAINSAGQIPRTSAHGPRHWRRLLSLQQIADLFHVLIRRGARRGFELQAIDQKIITRLFQIALRVEQLRDRVQHIKIDPHADLETQSRRIELAVRGNFGRFQRAHLRQSKVNTGVSLRAPWPALRRADSRSCAARCSLASASRTRLWMIPPL